MSRIFLLAVSVACLVVCGPIWLLGLGFTEGHRIAALLGLPIVGLPILGITLVIRDSRKARNAHFNKAESKSA